METPKRFDNAVTKLYNAFHHGELNAYSCTHCAVGNICNNNNEWMEFLQPKGRFMNEFRLSCTPNRQENEFDVLDVPKTVKDSGYSMFQISMIEAIFIKGWCSIDGFYDDSPAHLKEAQFEGLCAVVEYLCELDNIQNVMDYTKLFETENDKPKYQLS